MSRSEVNYSHENGLTISTVRDFSECSFADLSVFWKELNSKQDVKFRIIARFTRLEKYDFTEKDILKEYLICFYGGNDNRVDCVGDKTASDYCHCGCRGNCPDENYKGLCSQPKIDDWSKLNPIEIEVLKLASLDFSEKEISNIRHRSRHTIQAQYRSIRTKMHCRGMIGAVTIAQTLGIIKSAAL